MPKKKIIILGAGLAGLSAAWHLQRKGLDCRVFEKEPEVGGLCRSKEKNGFIFDYDGHLLHFRHRDTFNLVKDSLGNNLLEHERQAWVYSSGSYSRYPFQANLYGLPAAVAKECLLGFIEVNNNGGLKGKDNNSFLDWIKHNFGRGIARHFMVPYNTKFWTLPPRQLTCEWLDGFIPVPSLAEIVEASLRDSDKKFGYNARFWYPKKGGINQLPLGLAAELKNIHTNCKISEIDPARKEITIWPHHKEKFDYLISTIPLPELPRIIKGMPADVHTAFGKLKWNSIFNLNLGIDTRGGSGKHWIYFPQKDHSFFRVGCFHNFSSNLAPVGKSALYAEVAYSRHKPIDKDKIIPRIEQDLIRVGMLAGSDKILARDINDIEYGYPIYDRHYSRARKKILGYLSGLNIIPCGRYGSWRYMSMEDVILDGRDTFLCT